MKEKESGSILGEVSAVKRGLEPSGPNDALRASDRDDRPDSKARHRAA